MGKPVVVKKKKKSFLYLYTPITFRTVKKNFLKRKGIFVIFLLTDETHLNASLIKLIKNLITMKKKKILNLEQFIQFRDLFKLVIKNLNPFKKYENYFLNNSVIDGMNFKNEIVDLYDKSVINRAKLEIYSSAIPRFLSTYEIKMINLYLFEYNFGFFLARSIREHSKKIKITGYQHGIFSDQLTWFDLILSSKFKNIYLPDYILSSNKFSLKDYKSKLHKKISLKLKKGENKNFLNSIKIEKKIKWDSSSSRNPRHKRYLLFY